MKKVNNKGFSVVELIFSFVFVFTIAFGMYGLIFNYRTKQNEESIKSQLSDYTNEITLAIQTDINERVLKDIDYCTIDDELIDRCLILYFNDGTSKQLAIESDVRTYDGEVYNINYVVYGGIIYESPDAILLDFRAGYMLYNTYESDQLEDENVKIFRINIPIHHNDLEGNHGISIVAVAYDYEEGSTPDEEMGGGADGSLDGDVCDLKSDPEELKGEAYALILDNSASASDKLPMIFVRSETPIKAGDTYNSKTYGNIKVKGAYTGFETETYSIRNFCPFERNSFNCFDILNTPWSDYSLYITSVIAEDKVRFASLESLFNTFASLNYADVGNIDVSKNTSFNFMFANVSHPIDNSLSIIQCGGNDPLQCSIGGGAIQIIGLEKWNTSCIADMSSMFVGGNLKYIDIGSWITTNVTNMSSMFYDSYLGFEHALDLSKWNVDKVTNWEYFYNGESVIIVPSKFQ